MLRTHFFAICLIIVLTAIWGSTWLVIKIGLDDLPPFLFAGIRFSLAFVVLRLFMLARREHFPRDRHSFKVMTVLGILLMLDYACVFWAEQYIDSALAAILFATMPFFVVICNQFMVSDYKIGWLDVVGICISFGGVVLIFREDLTNLTQEWNTLAFAGNLVMIVAAILAAYHTVYAKLHANEIPAAANTTVQMLICAIFLLTAGFVLEEPLELNFQAKGVFAISYLAIFGSAVSFALLMWVIKRVTVLEISIIPLGIPVVALFLGWIFRDERLSAEGIAGAILIMLGLAVTNLLQPVVARGSTSGA